jgi:hypothetical protein
MNLIELLLFVQSESENESLNSAIDQMQRMDVHPILIKHILSAFSEKSNSFVIYDTNDNEVSVILKFETQENS